VHRHLAVASILCCNSMDSSFWQYKFYADILWGSVERASNDSVCFNRLFQFYMYPLITFNIQMFCNIFANVLT